jgi:riboflavin synthase
LKNKRLHSAVFTGIISDVGEVARATVGRAGGRLEVRAPATAQALRRGDSIAVDGVCLTATEVGRDRFVADVSAETAAATTLGELTSGERVNLELAMAAAGRFGGHLVQGHVDGVGTVRELAPSAVGYLLRVAVPLEISRYVVDKGSVAVAGISLTAVDAVEGAFAVAVIPHTHENTTLKDKRAGSRVNVEVDLIAKYVERFLGRNPGRGLTLERLAKLGYSD